MTKNEVSSCKQVGLELFGTDEPQTLSDAELLLIHGGVSPGVVPSGEAAGKNDETATGGSAFPLGPFRFPSLIEQKE